MKSVCLEGDPAYGTCYSHSTPRAVQGVGVGSEERCVVEGLKTMLQDDIVQFNCGHTGRCIASSKVSTIYGKPIVLDGDRVISGSGIITAVIHATHNVTTTK